MYMKISEVLDRYTILKMKALYDDDAKKELYLYQKELARIIDEQIPKGSDSLAELISYIVELGEANARTWENEAALRNECEKDPANAQDIENNHSEIGRRAKIIRGHNKQRIKAKTAIDIMMGQFPDNKVDHASA